MDRRSLGHSGLDITPLGFGTFKLGRNKDIKYPEGYELPSDEDASNLLNGVLDLGINLLDTAPAYGCSEERIGSLVSSRRSDFLLCTKAGEQWTENGSTYDFSPDAIRDSLEGSLQRLKVDQVDLLLVHSDGGDVEQHGGEHLAAVLQSLRDQGKTRLVGFSGKTPECMMAATRWSDVVMVEYNYENRAMEDVIRTAADEGVGVLVKKGLGSGHLDPARALTFLLRDAPVKDTISSIIIGSGSLQRMRENVALAEELLG